MAESADAVVRGPKAYAHARQALDRMERQGVWPTPLNYELWLCMVCEPDGALAAELNRLAETGEPITEALSEELAALHLPKQQLGRRISDSGDHLTRQLEQISSAVGRAEKTNERYGVTLSAASRDLNGATEPAKVQQLVQGLAAATQKVLSESQALDRRLSGSTAEIKRLRADLAQIRRDASTDPLTGLANRRRFDEHLQHAILRSQRDKQPLALAVLDIDQFKTFNDTWGHQTGDQVLRYVSTVIARRVGKPCLAARYGGEEFAVIFAGADANAARGVLEAIRVEIGSRLLTRRSTNEYLGAVTISAGVTEHRPGETAADLIERADAALFTAKRGGRNRIEHAVAR